MFTGKSCMGNLLDKLVTIRDKKWKFLLCLEYVMVIRVAVHNSCFTKCGHP